jgi:tRNA 2-thiouridine synthesizing protein E
MFRVRVWIKATGEPMKRTPITAVLDAGGGEQTRVTNRAGIAEFDLPSGAGRVFVAGRPRYQGHLDELIDIEIWSPTDSAYAADTGAPAGVTTGSTAYPNMQTHALEVDGRMVLTDSEGYLVDLGDWSEAFVRAEAAAEGLELTNEHWEVIRFLREHYEHHGVQAQVRELIRHFRALWGAERGSNRYLHDLFPRGGPQKQGNRLAGLLKTKGEH